MWRSKSNWKGLASSAMWVPECKFGLSDLVAGILRCPIPPYPTPVEPSCLPHPLPTPPTPSLHFGPGFFSSHLPTSD